MEQYSHILKKTSAVNSCIQANLLIAYTPPQIDSTQDLK